MFAKIAILVFVATLLGVVLAENKGCPHPDQAKNLILQELLVLPASQTTRHAINVQVPGQVVGHEDLTCVSLVANHVGSTPDYVSYGRDETGGYTIIAHTRLRNPLNATLYVYTS